MQKRKRNPQDATRRNITASARRDAQLMARILKLEQAHDALVNTVMLLASHQSFAANQRSMGYRHSTSAPHQIRVK